MRKGIELPVNVLVIVAVAVIVLLGIVALFMGGFGSAAGTFASTLGLPRAFAQDHPDGHPEGPLFWQRGYLAKMKLLPYIVLLVVP